MFGIRNFLNRKKMTQIKTGTHFLLFQKFCDTRKNPPDILYHVRQNPFKIHLHNKMCHICSETYVAYFCCEVLSGHLDLALQ